MNIVFGYKMSLLHLPVSFAITSTTAYLLYLLDYIFKNAVQFKMKVAVFATMTDSAVSKNSGKVLSFISDFPETGSLAHAHFFSLRNTQTFDL